MDNLRNSCCEAYNQTCNPNSYYNNNFGSCCPYADETNCGSIERLGCQDNIVNENACIPPPVYNPCCQRKYPLNICSDLLREPYKPSPRVIPIDRPEKKEKCKDESKPKELVKAKIQEKPKKKTKQVKEVNKEEPAPSKPKTKNVQTSVTKLPEIYISSGSSCYESPRCSFIEEDDEDDDDQEEDEACPCSCKPQKSSCSCNQEEEDLYGEFFSVVRETMEEAVKKCFEEVFGRYFACCFEKMNSLASQIEHTECLLKKMHKDLKDRMSACNQSQSQKFQNLCQQMRDDIVSTYQKKEECAMKCKRPKSKCKASQDYCERRLEKWSDDNNCTSDECENDNNCSNDFRRQLENDRACRCQKQQEYKMNFGRSSQDYCERILENLRDDNNCTNDEWQNDSNCSNVRACTSHHASFGPVKSEFQKCEAKSDYETCQSQSVASFSFSCQSCDEVVINESYLTGSDLENLISKACKSKRGT